ncbi:hypothetical protein BOX15_Mlig019451g1, partial [Macrostomum lignano]
FWKNSNSMQVRAQLILLLIALLLLQQQQPLIASDALTTDVQTDVFPVQPTDCLFDNDTCNSNCFDSSRRCILAKSSNHSYCFGVPRESRVSNQSLVTGAANMQAWEAAFSNLADCWSKLKPLLCEFYEPRCLGDGSPYRLAPSRKLCKYSRKSCSLLLSQLFPSLAIDILDCEKYPAERVCSAPNVTFSPRQQEINYRVEEYLTQKRRCLYPLVATNSVKVQFAYDEFKGCDLKCLSPLYKDSAYPTMRLILSPLSIILVLINALIVVSFIASWQCCYTVPRQTLLFVYLCFLLLSCNWLTQVISSAHFDIVCRRDGTLRTGEPLLNRDDSISCVVVFVLTHFASMSSQLSFLLFALTVRARICRFCRRHYRRQQRLPIVPSATPASDVDADQSSRPIVINGNSTADEPASAQIRHDRGQSSDNSLPLLNTNSSHDFDGIDGQQGRSDSSCLIVRPATQWIIVIAAPIVFLIVALATNEIEGDPISGVCIVSRGNPLARLGLHTCPMIVLLLASVALLCDGYRTLRSLDPHLDLSDRKNCWSKHVQRWGKGERIMYQSLLYSFGHRSVLFAVPIVLCCALYLGVDIYAFLCSSDWRTKIYDYVLCQMRREFVLQSGRYHQPPPCQMTEPPSYVPLLLQAVCHPVLNFAFYLWLPEPLLKGWRDLWHRVLSVCRIRPTSGSNSPGVYGESTGNYTAASEPGQPLHHHQHHQRRHQQQQSHFYQQLAYLFADSDKTRQQLMRRCQQQRHHHTEFRNASYYQQQQQQQQQTAAPAGAASTVVARVGGVVGGGSERTSIGSCSLLSSPVSDTDIYDGQGSLQAATAAGGAPSSSAAGSTVGRGPRHSSLGRDSRRIGGSGRRRRVAMTTGGGHHHRNSGSVNQQQQQQQPQPEAIYQPGASGQSRISAQSRASLLTYRSATSERRRQEFEHYLMHYIRPLEYILWQAYREGFDDALSSADPPATQEAVEDAGSNPEQQQPRAGGTGFNPQRLLQYNFGLNFPPGSPMMQQHQQQFCQQPQPSPQPSQPSPAPPPARTLATQPEQQKQQDLQQQQQEFFRRLQSRSKAPPRHRQSDEFDSEDEECRTPPDYNPAGFLPTGEHEDENLDDDVDVEDDDLAGEDSDEFDSEAEINSDTEEQQQAAAAAAAADGDIVDGDGNANRQLGSMPLRQQPDGEKFDIVVVNDEIDSEYMVPIAPLKALKASSEHPSTSSGTAEQDGQQQSEYFLYDAAHK